MLPDYQPINWQMILVFPSSRELNEVMATACSYLASHKCSLILRGAVKATGRLVLCPVSASVEEVKATLTVLAIELQLAFEAVFPEGVDEVSEKELLISELKPIGKPITPDAVVRPSTWEWDYRAQGQRIQSLSVRKVEELDLSVRTYSVLKRASCETVGDIVKNSSRLFSETSRARGFGVRSRAELIEQMGQLGFQLEADSFVFRPKSTE